MNDRERGNPAPKPGEVDGAFARGWDHYADQAAGRGGAWPGDDWGDAGLWDAWFARLFAPHEVDRWRKAVEIGQGTGKYTQRVLAAGCREVLAADVSERFLELCERRQERWVKERRLHLRRIDERDPRSLPAVVHERGWTGVVDALFSIDTMVHLTWTQVVAILAASTEFLRPGGLAIFSFADCTTETGFHKMLADVKRTLEADGDPATGCFQWVSPSLVRDTAERLGFDVLLCEPDDQHHRDGHFVGRFTDPERASSARARMAGS